MKQYTVCFCVRDGKVLLALKNYKIGAGFLNGYGGRVEEHDLSVADAAVRELSEECSIRAKAQHAKQAAQIAVSFDDVPTLELHIFIVHQFIGEPVESKEMGKAEWYPIDSLPEERMWLGDRLWLPRILKGEILKGTINYSSDKKEVLDSNFEPAIF